MRRLAGIFALLALLAACGQMELTKSPSEEREVPVEAEAPTETVPESGTLQSAVLEGEALSPDGRFLARIEGSGADFCDMGFPSVERLEIANAKTGEGPLDWERVLPAVYSLVPGERLCRRGPDAGKTLLHQRHRDGELDRMGCYPAGRLGHPDIHRSPGV